MGSLVDNAAKGLSKTDIIRYVDVKQITNDVANDVARGTRSMNNSDLRQFNNYLANNPGMASWSEKDQLTVYGWEKRGFRMADGRKFDVNRVPSQADLEYVGTVANDIEFSKRLASQYEKNYPGYNSLTAKQKIYLVGGVSLIAMMIIMNCSLICMVKHAGSEATNVVTALTPELAKIAASLAKSVGTVGKGAATGLNEGLGLTKLLEEIFSGAWWYIIGGVGVLMLLGFMYFLLTRPSGLGRDQGRYRYR